MKTINFPHTTLRAPQVVAGMMRIGGMDNAGIRRLVQSALDNGIPFFDHADIYGGDHLCERRFAEACQWTPAERETVILQSKCGIVQGKDLAYFDFSRDHIVDAVEGSLRALNTDYIDILLLHRPDALVEPEEVARAFDELESAGKVRHFGVSNQTPARSSCSRRAYDSR